MWMDEVYDLHVGCCFSLVLSRFDSSHAGFDLKFVQFFK